MVGTGGAVRFKTTGDLEVTEMSDGLAIYDEAGQKVHYLDPVAAAIYSSYNTFCAPRQPFVT